MKKMKVMKKENLLYQLFRKRKGFFFIIKKRVNRLQIM
nr:MAG TPA: hypothetical protein [Caudoviricetes sp.]